METHLNLESFLAKKFDGQKTRLLSSLTEKIKHGSIIPKGTLVIMASGDTRLRLKILNKDTPHKGFSTPLKLSFEAVSLGLSPSYLHWFLSQEEISMKLMAYVTGSVILRIPISIINSIPIPLPQKKMKFAPAEDTVLLNTNDNFKILIMEFFEDYRLCIKNKRYRNACIIAGAITETMVYQLLIEYGVEKRLLEGAHASLGRFIDYMQLLRFDKEFGVPITHIQGIQKSRNSAVHIGFKKSHSEFQENNLRHFDQIIKFFGL